MTLGQKIKQARMKANLTQKSLADTLNVTFQTISKWENGTTEPDLATIRALARALGCTFEYLVSEDDGIPKPEEDGKSSSLLATKAIVKCRDCGRIIPDGELSHNIERRSPSGVKENVIICDRCFRAHEEEMERRAKEVEQSLLPESKTGPFHKITDRNDKKPLIWSLVIGGIAMVLGLVLGLVNHQEIGIGWAIGGPIVIGYVITATIYCIFTASYVSDIFMTVAGWSINFPGLIFTWDLEGFVWLIVMKIFFFVLGILIGVAAFLLAVAISAAFSIFTFIPLLIYNKTHY